MCVCRQWLNCGMYLLSPDLVFKFVQKLFHKQVCFFLSFRWFSRWLTFLNCFNCMHAQWVLYRISTMDYVTSANLFGALSFWTLKCSTLIYRFFYFFSEWKRELVQLVRKSEPWVLKCFVFFSLYIIVYFCVRLCVNMVNSTLILHPMPRWTITFLR